MKSHTPNTIYKHLIIASVLFGSSILIYTLNFYDHPFSSRTSNWGEFGDFLGGVVNPMIGLITIWLLVDSRHQADHHQHEQSESFNKEIALTKAQKTLNEAMAFVNFYENSLQNKRIQQEEETSAEKLEVIKSEVALTESKKSSIERFIDNKFDDLIDELIIEKIETLEKRAIYLGMNFSKREDIYKDYKYKITLERDRKSTLIDILDNNENYVYFKLIKSTEISDDMEASQTDKFLRERGLSIAAGVKEARKLIDVHGENRNWPQL